MKKSVQEVLPACENDNQTPDKYVPWNDLHPSIDTRFVLNLSMTKYSLMLFLYFCLYQFVKNVCSKMKDVIKPGVIAISLIKVIISCSTH